MDKMKEAKDVITGKTAGDQAQKNPKDNSKDTMVDSAVDSFADKKGMPASANPELNNTVNAGVNKFT
ncbi:hypothetical protein F4780DRAFT_519346 [Xylariomycetidae sp. FL0641]|nr:hypothetical protein F4780DRAFT_519346 [Xylariomycetidae sp. FL0641]